MQRLFESSSSSHCSQTALPGSLHLPPAGGAAVGAAGRLSEGGQPPSSKHSRPGREAPDERLQRLLWPWGVGDRSQAQRRDLRGKLRETTLVPWGRQMPEAKREPGGCRNTPSQSCRKAGRFPEAGQSEKSFGDGIGKVTVAGPGRRHHPRPPGRQGDGRLGDSHRKHAAGLEPCTGARARARTVLRALC